MMTKGERTLLNNCCLPEGQVCSVDQIYNKIRYAVISKDLSTCMSNCYCFIKGASLSKYAYGNVGMRKSSDIDILVPRGVVDTLSRCLLEAGYTQKNGAYSARTSRVFCISTSHQLLPFAKNIHGVNIEVDLNFDIFWGEYDGKRVDINEFIDDAVTIDVYGSPIKTLTPLKTMVQLILHHYKDLNSIYLLTTRNNINPVMFRDVFFLLKNNLETISVQQLYHVCKAYEIIPYAFYVLYYTNRIYNDNVLSKYVDAFRTDEGELLLNSYGLNAKERRPWRYDFETRLVSNNLYDLIKNDLSQKDKEKIELNKNFFRGGK